MTRREALQMLDQFKGGQIGRDQVVQAFQSEPLADLGYAKVDTHRGLRQGFPEVIYGAGKTPEQITGIATEIMGRERRLLVTRVTRTQAEGVLMLFDKAIYHAAARCLTIDPDPLPKNPGRIAVLTAGTSDQPVAEEAVITADIMGNEVQRIYDVGVAGLHRLLSRLEAIQTAHVLIVVAGMEGALPSVVAGLVARPVIAVPTSVGYGAGAGGFAALFAMLNSCGSGVTVVNIDNGFGAGFAASQINTLAAQSLP